MPQPFLNSLSPKARRLLVAALLVPAPALAKAGNDALEAATSAFALFAVFAFLIVAEVFRRTLGASSLRALGWSALCHLASLPVVAAAGLALVMIPAEAHFVAVTAFLALLYGVSWLVHWPVAAALVKRGAQKGRMSARGATLAANAVCLAITGAIVVAAMPGPGSTPRAKVKQALGEMDALAREVTQGFGAGRGLPAPRTAATSPEGPLQSLRIENAGRIVGTLRIARERQLDGKRIFLEPRLEASRLDHWICYTDADLVMTARFLPAGCRWSVEGIERDKRAGGRVGEPWPASPAEPAGGR